MGASVPVVDRVREAVDPLLVAVVPLQRDLDRLAGAGFAHLAVKVDRIRVQRRLVPAQVSHEAADPPFVLELRAFARPFIEEADRDAPVQEGEFPQALREHLVVEGEPGEDLRVRHEADSGAGRLGILERGDRFDRRLRHAAAVALPPGVAVAVDFQIELDRESVDHRETDPVQASRDLVGVLVELPAGMQFGHDDFRRRPPLTLVEGHRDSAAVVPHGDAAIAVDDDLDQLAEAGLSLVDRVVDELEHHVVQARAVIGVADVHPGPFPDRFEALEDLDVLGRVPGFGRRLNIRCPGCRHVRKTIT